MKNLFPEIQEALKTLDTQQRKAFAWRCAIRVLPFLGIRGHFNFWKDFTPWSDPEWKVSDILNAVQVISKGGIYAEKAIEASQFKIDLSAFLIKLAQELQSISKEISEIIEDDVDNEVMERFFDGQSDAYFNSERYNQCATVVDAAAFTVKVVGLAVNSCANKEADVSEVVIESIKFAKGYHRIDLAPIFLEDLKAIQENKLPEISGKSYIDYEKENIWNNFKRALRKEHLKNYLQDYEQIFKGNFEVNEAALQSSILSYLQNKEFIDFD